MDIVLKVSGARKNFGSVTALDGAELTLARREWLGLLGPNGAGKTTLVRAIAGRVRLNEGTVELLGQTLDGGAKEASAGGGGGEGGARGRLGVIPQEIALYPDLTAVENLAAFARYNGLVGSDARTQIDWALSWTALADRAREPVKRFSGGMKRRLNIAAGVLHRPEVVLLDEPTVGVDPQSRERIWEMLSQLQADGASILLTTHQLDEAQKVCQRIVIIDHGKAIAAGTLDELVSRTVGRGKMVTLVLDRDAASARLDGSLGPGFEVKGREVRGRSSDLAHDLPALLAKVGQAGAKVEDVHVEAASLQQVFLHLTGRELRE